MIKRVSTETKFIFGDEAIVFSDKKVVPKFDESKMRMKLTGIQLQHEFSREKDGNIIPILKAFGADFNGVIKTIPENLTIEIIDDAIVLKYGKIRVSKYILNKARKHGVSNYWDASRIVICAAGNYKDLIWKAADLIEPKKVRISLEGNEYNRKLVLSV